MRRNGSRVAGVQKTEEIERFSERISPSRIRSGRWRSAAFRRSRLIPQACVLFAPCFEADQVLVGQLNLSGILNQQDALVGGNEFPRRRRRLFFPSLFHRNNKLRRLKDIVFEPVGERPVESSRRGSNPPFRSGGS